MTTLVDPNIWQCSELRVSATWYLLLAWVTCLAPKLWRESHTNLSPLQPTGLGLVSAAGVSPELRAGDL